MDAVGDIFVQLLFYIVPVVIYVVLAFAVGHYAQKEKGREYVQWVGVAIVVTPLIAFIIAALLNPAANTDGIGPFRKCPKCAEMVRSEATICRFCRSELDAVAQTEQVSK